MHSISSISELPAIDRVIHISQSLALLDAILMPDWEHRYFLFNAAWDGPANEKMASMRNGAGDESFLLFTPNGAVGKVLSTEEMLEDVDEALSSIPVCFGGFKSEPAFKLQEMTFCIWRQTGDQAWFSVPADRDSYPWLRFLVGGASYYRAWAADYYEKDINPYALQRVYQQHDVTDEVIAMLKPEASRATVEADLSEILGGGRQGDITDC